MGAHDSLGDLHGARPGGGPWQLAHIGLDAPQPLHFKHGADVVQHHGAQGLGGRIKPTISAAAPSGSRDGAGEPGYRASILLGLGFFVVHDNREKIQPGMRVAVVIKTVERRVIEYLLSPVVQAVSEAGRER